MLKTILPAGLVVAAGLMTAQAAFAECDARQEDAVGRAVAEQAQDAAASILPEGQGVLDIDRCLGGGRAFDVQFTYRVKSNGESYWVKGHASGTDDQVTRFELTRMSSNLKTTTQLARR